MNAKTDPHNYGIDLLRIAAMFMIVAHHFSLHSGLSFERGSVNDILMQILALGGKTGVNIFVLITGFCSSGRIRRGKIFRLIGCATLYSLVLTATAVLAGSAGFGAKMLLKAAVPLLFGDTYWFITTYLELYILIPVLNLAAGKLDQTVYRNYLLLFTVILCILPQVAGKFIHVNDLGYSPLVWFVHLYFLGVYLRKYGFFNKKSRYMYISVCCAAVQIGACTVLRCEMADGWAARFLECAADYSANALFPLTIAVSMLLWFQSVEVPAGRNLIGLLGTATLGVYLFHDHVNFRGLLWQNVFRIMSGPGTWPFAASAMLTIAAVFALGCAIELLRAEIPKHLRRFFGRNRTVQ